MNKKEDKKKINEKNLVKTVENLYNGQDYKQSYELLLEVLKENSLNLQMLIWKMKLENQLKKFDDCLISCNNVLFLQPNNLEAHQIKLNILKIQQKFNYLSDCLVIAMTLFPNVTFS